MNRFARFARKPSKKRAASSLASLLNGCRVEMLASFTAEGLAASYNVSPATAAKMLGEAKQRRAANG